MGPKRLQNAAEAAGFAMVNPEDFQREAPPVPRKPEVKSGSAAQTTPSESESKNWLIWDYTRLIGGKATA